MNSTKEILVKKDIVPEFPIISLKNQDALDAFQEAMDYLEIKFDFTALSTNDFLQLFNEYANCVFLYHPEQHHQERACFDRCKEIFLKHGLSKDEVSLFDFV